MTWLQPIIFVVFICLFFLDFENGLGPFVSCCLYLFSILLVLGKSSVLTTAASPWLEPKPSFQPNLFPFPSFSSLIAKADKSAGESSQHRAQAQSAFTKETSQQLYPLVANADAWALGNLPPPLYTRQGCECVSTVSLCSHLCHTATRTHPNNLARGVGSSSAPLCSMCLF